MILVLLSLIYSIFILPIFTKSFDNTYVQQISYHYGSINFIKIPILIFLIYFLNKRYNYLLCIVIILFLPSHCPFNLCYYTPPVQEERTQYVNFLGIGDIQNSHFRGNTKYANRIKATKVYIEAINEFSEKVKTKNFSKIKFENKDAFESIKSDHFIGLINVGDCTQSGNNIGRVSKNDIGAYEFGFVNNPSDNGLLKLSTFEILGNHDYFETKDKYDLIKNFFLFEGNPFKNMLLRRNRNRKFLQNKDRYGNYSLLINDLLIVFINVWPTHLNLFSGNPEGSVEFLSQELENKKDSQPFLIVTHYLPFINSWDELMWKPFGDLYEKYGKDLLGVIHGHIHLKHLVKRVSKVNVKHLILPGPAAYIDHYDKIKKIEIAWISYLNKLNVFTIEATPTVDGFIYRVY